MYISERSFPHLVAAEDARIAEALERRRLAGERLDEEAPTGRRARRLAHRPARRAERGRSAEQLFDPAAARHA